MKSIRSLVVLSSVIFVASSVANELLVTKRILIGSLPAVAQTNGKFEVGIGAIQGDGLAYGAATVVLPIGHTMGAQVDVLASNWSGAISGGFAGHAFWRNPAYALAGLYGSFSYTDQGVGYLQNKDVKISRLGAELELYMGNVSFETILGIEGGDIRSRIFGITDIAFYPAEDFRLAAGYRYLGGKHIAALGAEYLTPLHFNGLRPALFAEARAGQDNNRMIIGGVRVYFGDEKKSLMARHRQDEVRNRLTDEMFSVTASQNDRRR